MSTDDRDIESSNPSKNFKVGDFDQRSGFFTPVWESKRRIRSDPPAPPSSASGSSRGRAPSSRSEQADEAPVADSSAASKSGGKNGKGVARSRATAGGGKSKRASSARSATPVPPAASEEGTPATLGAAPLPPAVAAVFDPAVELEPAPAGSSAPSESTASATDGAASAAEPEPAEAPARPSAAARALRDAGPNLPPAAFLDAEPEFRDTRAGATRSAAGRDGSVRPVAAPEERTDRSPVHQRSLRATSAAARVHEQLKAKLQAEAAELDESRFDQTPDSQLPSLEEQERANDPYPQSVLRQLRRTIRLSTPVPDPIRSLISKYDRG
jgi:hypothetical protein